MKAGDLVWVTTLPDRPVRGVVKGKVAGRRHYVVSTSVGLALVSGAFLTHRTEESEGKEDE